MSESIKKFRQQLSDDQKITNEKLCYIIKVLSGTILEMVSSNSQKQLSTEKELTRLRSKAVKILLEQSPNNMELACIVGQTYDPRAIDMLLERSPDNMELALIMICPDTKQGKKAWEMFKSQDPTNEDLLYVIN
jgi:hypothetical protein